MTSPALLIFNPVSGSRDPNPDLQQIRALLGSDFDLDIVQTSPDSDPTQMALEGIAQGAEVILAAGGDGTISAVAQALYQTPIPLGIIPRGSGNVFANALQIPLTISGACQVICAGNTRRIDVAECNGHPVFVRASFGYGAETVGETPREWKRRLGLMAYVVEGIRQLARLQRFVVILEIEGKPQFIWTSSVAVANATTPTSILAQGSGEVIVDDGYLDVTLIDPVTVPNALWIFAELFRSALRRRPSNHQDIKAFRARQVKITAYPQQRVVIDGEWAGVTPLELQCHAQGLTVLAPET